MLMMPPNASRIARIFGIDPGTNTLGVAELSFDVETLEVLNISAKTLTAEKHTRHWWSNEIYGDRFSRITWLEEELFQLLHESDPFQVAIESPFFNRRRPQAFESLVEIKFAITRAIQRWSPSRPVYLIDPPSVKKAVGAKTYKTTKGQKINPNKTAVRDAVLGLDLPYTGDVPIEDLDEHSYDGIAVVIARFEQMKEELCLL